MAGEDGLHRLCRFHRGSQHWCLVRAGRDHEESAALHPLELRLHDPELGRVALVVDGVDGEQRGADAFEPGRRVVVARCVPLVDEVVGIGVGLYAGEDGGYGAAQRLYIKRGYIPDGQGVTYNYEPTMPGNSYPLDDDLVLWFLKRLK